MGGLKSKTITINNEKKRDHGKSYRITEMNVLDIDEWAIRVGCAMARGGLNVKEIDFSQGLSTDTVAGILELLNLGVQGFGNMMPSEVKDLADELVNRCVKFVSTSGQERTLDIRNAHDVQDLTTLWLLRKEAFNIHTDFFAQDES